MSKIFINIYLWFGKHRFLFWTALMLSTAVLALMASHIGVEENITAFFPSGKGSRNVAEVFSNLKVSDKTVVMFTGSGNGEMSSGTEDSLVLASARLGQMLAECGDCISGYSDGTDGSAASDMLSFVLDHLPLFMEESDYERLAQLDRPEVVDSAIMVDYLTLVSPAGLAMKDYVMSDPLSISGSVLSRLSALSPDSDYQIRSGHVFTRDGRTMLAFVEPVYASGETGRNDRLVSEIETRLDSLAMEFPSVETHFFGGPVMSVYNARRIKLDTYGTAAVAFVIILLFILAVFKRRQSVFLILVPVAYGMLFALAFSWLVQGSISGIAIGAGAAIMGIALSYSIHLLAHQNHVKDVCQLLGEIASPLVIGSITTIGAFAGLLFTSSGLLRDFGLFASFTLLGTMIFCLVFLPQFLTGNAHLREGRILRLIEKISSYPFDRNKWLLAALAVVTAVCAYTSLDVRFDSDMTDLTWWEPKLREAERILNSGKDDGTRTVMFVNTGADADEAYENRRGMLSVLDSLRTAGKVISWASAEPFIAGPEEQEKRMERWRSWWTGERIARLEENVRKAAAEYGFREDAFDNVIERLGGECGRLNWFSDKDIPAAFSVWTGSSPNLKMFITRVKLEKKNISDVYGSFASDEGTVIFDRSYFASMSAQNINDDLYLILYISSILVFLVLWISYGRLELALLSFLPMALSWIIILGLMGMLGIRFNIVNVILSTFIFGMGDDFSIFIMDGLMYRYRTGKKLLDPHKTAIFFSAFTMIVGIGALIFARHPALHSIALITIPGMLAVVLIAYTVEPVIFNAFITSETFRGRPPFTFGKILRDILFYVPVAVGCLLIVLYIVILLPLPLKRERKQALAAGMFHRSCRFLIRISRFIKSEKTGPDGRPAVKWTGESGIITANHQSSLDIILIVATFPKVKFMVADWVAGNPLYGFVSRFLGYYNRSEGYEKISGSVREDIESGWSLVVFPEGTRSPRGEIRRFHKGAFLLASQTGAPLIPVVFYGNWRIMPKGVAFNMSEGLSVMKILSPVYPEGRDYHDLTRMVQDMVKSGYSELCAMYDSPLNPYFRKALESAYIYKGPVTEWYVKVKTAMERDYAKFHTLLPRAGQITDIGCGMGQLDYMLSMYCPDRKILGIDYDEEKISVAENCWMKFWLPDLSFSVADASGADLPESDAFVISDMLHYIDEPAQEALIRRCSERLKDGGIILVRDSDEENSKGQKVTSLSELFSTRIIGFNRTSGELHFLSATRMKELADGAGLRLRSVSNDHITSNTFYIMTR